MDSYDVRDRSNNVLDVPGPGDHYFPRENDTVHMTDSPRHNLSLISDTPLMDKNILDEPGHASIIDSTGVDSLSFKEFSKGVAINLNLWNTPQIYTDNGDTLILYGVFENIVGTEFNDSFRLQPNADNPITIDGVSGTDTLIVDCMGLDVIDNGQTITVNGYQPITYSNMTECVMNNTSSVKTQTAVITDFYLSQNYPNPFNPSTTIEYALPNTEHVKLVAYDVLGQMVAILVEEQQKAGIHTVAFNGVNQPSGIYIVQLETTEQTFTRSMLLLK